MSDTPQPPAPKANGASSITPGIYLLTYLTMLLVVLGPVPHLAFGYHWLALVLLPLGVAILKWRAFPKGSFSRMLGAGWMALTLAFSVYFLIADFGSLKWVVWALAFAGLAVGHGAVMGLPSLWVPKGWRDKPGIGKVNQWIHDWNRKQLAGPSLAVVAIGWGILQWVLVSKLDPDATLSETQLYVHWHLLLTIVTLFLSVGISGLVIRNWITKGAADYADALDRWDSHLPAPLPESANEDPDLVGAFWKHFLLVLLGPACVVVIIPEKLFGSDFLENLPFIACFSLLVSIVMVGTLELKRAGQRFLAFSSRVFGGSGGALLSLVVIGLALARLLKVDYVTTILDTQGYVVVLPLFWLYLIVWHLDVWPRRAFSLALLDVLNHQNRRSERKASLDGLFWINCGLDNSIGIDDLIERIDWGVRHRRQESSAAGGASKGNPEKAMRRLITRKRWCLYLPRILFAGVVLVWYLFFPKPVDPVVEASAVELPKASFDLVETLKKRGGEGTVYAIAASGGGTRAALYTEAMFRGLRLENALKDVVLCSSVSGGSAAVAYFANHRDALLAADPRQGSAPWVAFREAVTYAYIRDVLASDGEYRYLTGTRHGHVLAERFEKTLGPTGDGQDGTEKKGAFQDGILPGSFAAQCDVGLLINTALCGEAHAFMAAANGVEEADLALSENTHTWNAGGRFVFSNMDALLATSVDPPQEPIARLPAPAFAGSAGSWSSFFPYIVACLGDVPVTQAATLSANFPPIFSNAAVSLTHDAREQSRYWVTDGGAVENRGLLSLLLALDHCLEIYGGVGEEANGGESAQASKKDGAPAASAPRQIFPDMKILVADASAFNPKFSQDRGLGAVGSASRQVSNTLIGILAARVGDRYAKLGGGATFEIVACTLPDPLRVSGSFGTHWMLPRAVTVRNPDAPADLDDDEEKEKHEQTLFDTELPLVFEALFDEKLRKELEEKGEDGRRKIPKDLWSWFETNPAEILGDAIGKKP